MSIVCEIAFYSKLIKLFDISSEGDYMNNPVIETQSVEKRKARLKTKVGKEISRSTLRNYTEKQ